MTDFDPAPKTLTAGKTTYSYYRFGQGRPLVAVSGFHTDFERLKPLLQVLAEYFTVYFPVLPGIHTQKRLQNNTHDSFVYADYIDSWIKALKLEDYLLTGFCYGALISIRLLSLKNNSAKNLLLFEPLYDGDYIHVEWFMTLFIKFVLKLGPNNKLNNIIVDFLLHNENFLRLYFRIRLESEPNLDKVIKHQLSLTSMMDTRTTIELIREIFTLKLARENLHFNLPSILIFNKTDNIFDIPKIKNGITKILPNNQIFEVAMKRHAPAGPMDQSYISKLLSPLLPAILNLKTG